MQLKKIVRKINISIIFAMLLSIGLCFIFPDVAALKKENPEKTAFMKYREKEWQKEKRKVIIRHEWRSLPNISPYLIKAVLIAEDDKFYQHEGFDFEAIQNAVEKDIKQKRFKFGGSTISQQLVKNLYLSPSKNPARKLLEAFLTWRTEKTLSKKRILELYLNIAEWGNGIFGIEAASLHYYGKPASALNPEEAARLASVLPNPIKYNPAGTSAYVEKRSRIIHSIMVKRGIVTEEFDSIN